jgi:preprotein translocase subunit SecG
MSILINFLLSVWMLVALLMILVILMQRPKSEGLGAAFGGGVTENIFGAQTTNVLTKFTSWLAAIFFILTFVLSILYAKRGMGDTNLRQQLLKQQSGSAASASPGPLISPAPAGSIAPGAGPSPAASVASKPGPSAMPTVAPAPAAKAPGNQPPSPAATPKHL